VTRWSWAVAALALALYSGGLVRIEALYGQDALRPYVTDIDGPIGLYAVNTTLSASFLLGGAIIWMATTQLPGGPAAPRRRRYAVLQAAVLGALAFDDRFMGHEVIGSRTVIDETLLLGGAAVVQLVLLVVYRDVAVPDRLALGLILSAGAASGGMLLIDVFGGQDATLRLAAE
jgi:hypothetical protein